MGYEFFYWPEILGLRRLRRCYGKCTWRGGVKRSGSSIRRRRCDLEIVGWITAGGNLGGDTVHHRPKWGDQHANTLGHRRVLNRPSAHGAVRIGHFADEWTAGRLKVAV